MRASCASAAQQMITTRPRSVLSGYLRVKPVTVIDRPPRLLVESAAERITTSGIDTVGARPAGSGGSERRAGSVVATAVGEAPCAPSAGGTTNVVNAIGTNS